MFCFHGECYNTLNSVHNHNTWARDEVIDYVAQSTQGRTSNKLKQDSRRKYGKIK